MDNEEKKAKVTKTTATKKKSTATKKAPTSKTKETAPKKTDEKKRTAKSAETTKTEKKIVKKVTNPKVEKKTTNPTVRKTTGKKVVKKETVKEVVLPKEEIKEEEKVVVNETKVVEEKISKKELKDIRKKRYIIEAVIIAIVTIFVLMLLCNRTFLSLNYKTDNVNVSIPRFSYFVSDKDNEVKFVTLRKSDYLKEYYNEYLEGFTFYSCAEGQKTFYYNEKTKTLIHKIEIEKKFAMKTIEISYDSRTPEEVCGLR